MSTRLSSVGGVLLSVSILARPGEAGTNHGATPAIQTIRNITSPVLTPQASGAYSEHELCLGLRGGRRAIAACHPFYCVLCLIRSIVEHVFICIFIYFCHAGLYQESRRRRTVLHLGNCFIFLLCSYFLFYFFSFLFFSFILSFQSGQQRLG